MVTEWGMSDKLGMIAYGDNSQEVFLGHSVTQNKNVSELTARDIDGEIKMFIDNAYSNCKDVVDGASWTNFIGSPGVCSSMRPCRVMRSARFFAASR